MEWRGRRESGNVEDRRGIGAGGAGGIGVVGMLVVLAVGYFFGIDVSPIVGAVDQGSQSGESRPLTQQEQEIGQFARVVLADTEDVWTKVLPDQTGVTYRDPTLVLFSGVVQSACGGASAAMGPFYCPNDQKLYLDTDFFRIMQDKMGAGGDFAYAYVIGHEIGHHVQNLIGILGKVNAVRQRSDETTSNHLSVLTELQADCFAGVWAHYADKQLGVVEAGDVQNAIRAAGAVGDDVLMKQAGRVPMPDSFTHGSAADRQSWLMRGYKSGQMSDCNTFGNAGM
ncbi:KPN_02809 family neutral zinc metallopeptidase [Paracoccus aminophilus]|uniref:Zinc metallopeptidase n=1 Tax=Paracoccus aminophilus JCM 7686 TaxID=1367847 RepID=S5XSP5_PARAH|nr:neutral zinc metallopeptidase [Paracoccus aminophilus]AGT08142.1 zinc metallopeptidase [Paracoccus aminophilus JCM 7686]